ncbi:MAG: Single-stranded-DNA-specific exonuclease RecJ [candidate division WWE3 bacterium GW2011_GWA2_46_9]|uniref:Single-stranded-DNA-specific exonuclease RecJ n=2 Tax=Katanobacteria TaxID=422282 RepID=A0A0G1QW49_UNCKA|nr:MAG: Single-stranded-DNA-specific exonuclease RecJ [candidate division WWE3 bacterium GW2011_GWA2_46_9]KKU50884.1 MAG: Single-stranded-DNA-specific exonuclease RecJ [candidate division WWE3 bacterium GW2011_GWC1_47_10]
MMSAAKKWNVLFEGQVESADDVVAALLKNRNIAEPSAFLSPPSVYSYIKNLDASLKEEFRRAREMVLAAVKEKKQIVIYGDYDADGVCASAIVYDTIRVVLNYDKCLVFIPNRFDHGYGLSVKGIDDVVKRVGAERGLLITVDTGITATAEVVYAKKLGFDVLIADHHQKPAQLPVADHIIWTDTLVGSGIAYVLCRLLGNSGSTALALAAIATVTDLQPLLGMNRGIVKEGLRALNDSPPLGVKTLLEVAGKKGEVTSYDLGWVLGPRLNATGRIVNAYAALNLLIEKDAINAAEIATKLNELNKQRQDKTLEMYALANVSGEELPKVIFTASPDYHEGIIGLMASRLVGQYARPAVVISLADEYAKGSARSIAGVNIIEFLRNFTDLFVSLGGHAMAAGFTLKKANVAILQKAVLELAEKSLDSALLVHTLDIDVGLPFHLVGQPLLDAISTLQPFGLGNKEPLFLTKNVGVAQKSLMGQQSAHLALKLVAGETYGKAVFFNAGSVFDQINAGDKVDVVYSLRKNEFNGKIFVDMIVSDIRKR